MPMCVGVVVGVWGSGIERRPPFSRPPICRPPFACIVGAARLSGPPSAEIIGRWWSGKPVGADDS